MSILKLEHVNYQYEKSNINVINDINAQFETDKIYTIIGKSGAGKSTLLSLLSGLDVATKGEVLYKDISLKKLDRDDYRAKSIGIIFQGYNLLTNMSAVENIILAMNISGSHIQDKKQAAYHLLEQVGISAEIADRKVLKLSGGEQQRVGIARALSHDPDIIIADEPTGNLDGETEKGIMTILQKLAHEEHKCVIIVTHSKGVSTYADHCFKLMNGKLKEMGE